MRAARLLISNGRLPTDLHWGKRGNYMRFHLLTRGWELKATARDRRRKVRKFSLHSSERTEDVSYQPVRIATQLTCVKWASIWSESGKIMKFRLHS